MREVREKFKKSKERFSRENRRNSMSYKITDVNNHYYTLNVLLVRYPFWFVYYLSVSTVPCTRKISTFWSRRKLRVKSGEKIQINN